jgi:hypothetical protein
MEQQRKLRIMLSHIANYISICRWRNQKLRQSAKFFPPKLVEPLAQSASVTGLAENVDRNDGRTGRCLTEHSESSQTARHP